MNNPVVAEQCILPINDTAAAPSVSWGGGGNLGSNSSGTGIYGDESHIKFAVGGADILYIDSTGLNGPVNAAPLIIDSLLVNGDMEVTGNLTLEGSLFVSAIAGNIEANNFSASGDVVLNTTQKIVFLHGRGGPVDGTTGVNIAGRGSLYVSTNTGSLYAQTGDIASPVWLLVGPQP